MLSSAVSGQPKQQTLTVDMRFWKRRAVTHRFHNVLKQAEATRGATRRCSNWRLCSALRACQAGVSALVSKVMGLREASVSLQRSSLCLILFSGFGWLCLSSILYAHPWNCNGRCGPGGRSSMLEAGLRAGRSLVNPPTQGSVGVLEQLMHGPEAWVLAINVL